MSDTTSAATSGALTVASATSSPYYLHPSDNPGALISSVVLKENNYSEWATELKNSLQAKKKLGFIDGSIAKPTADPDLSLWLAANSMIVGWIRTSIDPAIRSTVSFVSDAATLWESLRVRFSVGNGVRKQVLKDAISACKQEGGSVLTYYGRLTKLWEELQNYQTSRPCTCAAAPDIAKDREDDKVHQFLFGLDLPRFTNIRSTITGEDPLPNLNQVYSRVIREEQNLHVVASTETTKTEAIGFSVRTESPSQVAAVSGQRFRDRSLLNCTHCRRQGHDVSECFLLHGFPDWYHELKGNSRGSVDRHTPHPVDRQASLQRGGRVSKGRGRGRANNARAAPSSDTGADQITQLINLLQSQRPQASPEKLSGKTYLNDVIIDTGASHHMTGDSSILIDVVDIIPSSVTFPDGRASRATKRGSLRLSSAYILTDVLFVPDFDCTLISVSKLLKQTGSIAIFTDTLCFLQDHFTRTLIGAGEEREGVYYFTGVLASRVSKVSTTTLSPAALWHRRLGHPSTGVFRSLPQCVSSPKDVGEIKSCDICFRSKQTREVFSESSNKALDCFSLVHCDVWGPYRTPSTSGSRYFLTLVDDYSRSVWTYLMNSKAEVPNLIRNFCAMAERQFGKPVKAFRSDNGTEFMCLTSYFQEHGILHQTSCVDTPQQNGRVERKHRHILNVARACLFQSHLPIKFWGESILAATHLINRTPFSVLHGKTPYELLFGTPPSYDMLRTFGCLCYAHTRSRDKDKFTSRSRRCILVGYPYGKKAWRLYDLESEQFFTSRDVRFQEDVFPFSTVQESSHPAPIKVSYDDDDWFSPVVTALPVVAENTTTPPSTEFVATMPSDSSASDTGGVDRQSPSPVDRQVSTAPQSPPPTSHVPDILIDDATPPSPGLPELLGRGHREKRPSVLLKDFVTRHTPPTPHASSSTPPQSISSATVSGKILYPLAEYLTNSGFSAHHLAFMAAILDSSEPTHFKDVVRIKEWCEAMQKEIDALEANHTWDITDLPPGKKAISSKWVYKLKFNSDGTLERYKARLVVMGNHQKEGIDYTETFAPVAKMTTVRTLLGVAAAKDWEVHQMDVHNAFLHGDLEEEVYMKLPPGFKCSDPTKVCRLRKSLYGLKQAPRCWFAKLSTALKELGFVQSYQDYSLFSLVNGTRVVHILVYVDDFIVAGNDLDAINMFNLQLHKCFHMKDLGKLKYFLGIEVSRGPDGFCLSQRKYALDIIKEAGLLGSKPFSTPMELNHKLASVTGPVFDNPEQYRRLVGRFIYLTITRPDLSYAVHILSQFMKTPLVAHWEAALRVVHYLKGTPAQGIFLRSDSSITISAYCDSDHSGCPLTRRSLSAYIVYLGDSPISWKTKKQDTVSSSSAEAEYRAMAYTLKELKWLKGLLQDLGCDHPQPMALHCDSKAAIHIASNPVFHERTKHIERDCHQVRDAVQDKLISTIHISTKDQVADLLTKSLPSPIFSHLMSTLGVRNFVPPT